MRWIGLIVVAAACAMQGQDWSRLGKLKPGTLIQVHSIGDPYGLDDRCRLEAVDPSLLRCVWEGDGATRMLYPADRVSVVYEVHRAGTGASGWVALGFLTLLIIGLATKNGGLIGLGFLGGLIALGVNAGPSIGMGQPSPPERLKLVYRR